MKLHFLDFWPGFIPSESLLFTLIKEVRPETILAESPLEADWIIYSRFGQSHLLFPKEKKIFYTGENLRPDYNQCVFSISFDENTPNNLRLPLWNLYIDWKDLSYLTSNKWMDKPKEKFCSFVYSNRTPLRDAFVIKLNEYKKVDCYGSIHDLKIPEGKSKINVISDYKFNICFENSSAPGYYTEKFLEAKLAGCIPLYWSDSGFGQDFNAGCGLNLVDYPSMDEFISDIIRIDKDNLAYESMHAKPLFLKGPTLDYAKLRLSNFFNAVYA